MKGKDSEKVEKWKKDRDDKELVEMTFKPVVNVVKNKKADTTRSGKKYIDLYKKSTVHLRKNKDSNDYDFERNQAECSFKPAINTSYKPKTARAQKIEDRVAETLAKKMEHIAKIAQESDGYNPSGNIVSSNKFIGGIDSAQYRPKRKEIKLTKERAALYLPKRVAQEPIQVAVKLSPAKSPRKIAPMSTRKVSPPEAL